jgi:hypothetical protein
MLIVKIAKPAKARIGSSLMPAHHPVHLAIPALLSKSIFWEINFPNFAVA